MKLRTAAHSAVKRELTELVGTLQVCRKRKYSGNSRGESAEEYKKKAKAVTVMDDMGEVCEFLIDLMASESSLDRDPGGLQVGDKRLLEEVELFFKTQTETNGS